MNDDKQRELELRFAWEWFQYHASQRLTAFNFFLVIMGALVVGYSQAAARSSEILGVALGLLGAIVSLAFWALDIRNQELVECGRSVLERAGLPLQRSIMKESENRGQLHKSLPWPVPLWFKEPPAGQFLSATKERGCRWFTHRRWLRLVLLVAFALSVGATAWAIAGFP